MGLLDKIKFVIDAPMNNDVSTTPGDPPEFEACARLPANEDRDLSWNGRRDALMKDEPLEPPTYDIDPSALFEHVAATAEDMSNWQIVAADPEAGRLEAVATTDMLNFKDDVVIELRGREVHVRSKSRLGRKDFGANEERIRAYLQALDERIEGA